MIYMTVSFLHYLLVHLFLNKTVWFSMPFRAKVLIVGATYATLIECPIWLAWNISSSSDIPNVLYYERVDEFYAE